MLLFVFKRADVTVRVLDAIRQQTLMPPKLIVFADAARHAGEASAVAEVAVLLKQIDWIPLELHFREKNYGGASNIIQGVSEALEHHDRVIVLEDDVLPASHFYEALSAMLDVYAAEDQIFSVGAYPYIRADALPDYPYDVILSPRFSIQGWGTWANRWQRVQSQMYAFKQPFAEIDSIPLSAGSDLPEIAQQAEANTKPFFWTGSGLILLSVYYGWRHALTRDYLVFNIARGQGQNASGFPIPHTDAFFEAHNALQDQLPLRYPPVAEYPEVDAAVQQYVADVYAMMRLDSKNAAIRKHPLRARIRRKLALEWSRLRERFFS